MKFPVEKLVSRALCVAVASVSFVSSAALPMPADLLGGSAVDFEAASARRFPSDGVADNVKRPMTELIDFRLSPGESLDSSFALSENQPALMTFILKGNPDKAKELEELEKDDRAARRAKKAPFTVELDFPEGVELADVACGKVLKSVREAGRVRLSLQMEVEFDIGLWKIRGTYNWWRRMGFLMRPLVAAGAPLAPARAWMAWDGRRVSNEQVFRFTVIPEIPAQSAPKRFWLGAEPGAGYVMGLSDAGLRQWSEFTTHCGLNALHVSFDLRADRRAAQMKIFRDAGVKELSAIPHTRLYNGYDLGPAKGRPDEAKFVAFTRGEKHVDPEQAQKLETRICPGVVIDRGAYYVEKVLPALVAELKGTDGFWCNWEPYMACGRGCFCARCKREFAAWSRLSSDDLALWPDEMARGGRFAKEFELFQSREHGRLMKTINADLRAAVPEAKLGFVPGVAWCTMCSTWRTNGYERATSPIDYAGDYAWVSPWGPYSIWMSQQPYVYSKWRNLRTFAAARDVEAQVAADYPAGNRPKLMAYAHGYQGDEWLIRPEAMEMNLDSFFFNRWGAALGYHFPNGYDQRWWAAFRRTAAKIAKYEDIVFDGRRCDAEVELSVVSPYAAPNTDQGQWTRGLPIALPMLQHAAYEKDGKLIVAAFNFWEKAPVFFRVRYRGRDLGEFYCGALRTKVWEFGKGAEKRVFTDADAAAWRAALTPMLNRAAAQDCAFEESRAKTAAK